LKKGVGREVLYGERREGVGITKMMKETVGVR
jgi:hypothetical protein